MKNHIVNLINHGACAEAIDFAGKYQTFKEVVAKCDQPDWLRWALRMLPQKARVAAATHIVRNTPIENGTVWELLTDERSRRAVETAEAFADGKATIEEVRAAAFAAAAPAFAVIVDFEYAAAAAAYAADAAANKYGAPAAVSYAYAAAAEAAFDEARQKIDHWQMAYIRSLDWSFMDGLPTEIITKVTNENK